MTRFGSFAEYAEYEQQRHGSIFKDGVKATFTEDRIEYACERDTIDEKSVFRNLGDTILMLDAFAKHTNYEKQNSSIIRVNRRLNWLFSNAYTDTTDNHLRPTWKTVMSGVKLTTDNTRIPPFTVTVERDADDGTIYLSFEKGFNATSQATTLYKDAEEERKGKMFDFIETAVRHFYPYSPSWHQKWRREKSCRASFSLEETETGNLRVGFSFSEPQPPLWYHLVKHLVLMGDHSNTSLDIRSQKRTAKFLYKEKFGDTKPIEFEKT